MKSEVVPSRVFFLGLLLLFFVRCLPSTAFNITDILGQHPDFSSFNDALTQTQVASLINSRQSLTVLALDNGAVSGLPSSQDALRAVLSLHVILDYFDLQKLQNMAQKSTILTTLYQTTGQANGMQGFLNVTVTNAGVMIGSAVPGSSLGSSLVKLVASQPYNISVLQVSSAIVPPGVGGNTNSSNPPSSPPGASSPPASSPKASPIIPLPPKFGNAPVPSATNSPKGSPSNASATSPSAGGATPPSAGGATPPSAGGATPPSAGGATPPSAGGATPPSAGGATPPSGPPSAGGAMPPTGASTMPPSGGGGILPGNASAPSNAGATPPAGATAPSDAAAATPAGATAPSGAGADSPAGAMPGNAPIGSPPMPAGAAPIADGPVADAPAPTVGTSAARRSYQSLDHASVLIISLAVIWSIGQLT
ncbi:hypothetical protein MLD38_031560 [Melastoma candidum]|uniref:Uncharacterized protein n=2 Tax=Melastoma candidum TaxID=119954 RepID=A0ACB9MQ33_9MYRT|nr:hypothetical protein MLD38_031560 [Melastoma candidum]